ncbi:MAG: hypothetical protein J7L44_04230 [Candidatus Diapherotrites archaeon]|nr:hypothetical protein [Candidatus Diapherotrites archaeon]
MKLPKEDVELFYKLYHSLLIYVNRKFNVVDTTRYPENLRKWPLDKVNQLRGCLYEHPDMITSFVNENPFGFSEDELKIIESWKHFVKGKFCIFRYLKNYTIFLDLETPPKAYGVLALTGTFEEIVGPHLPILVDAVLLPFKDKIIYDSIFSAYSIYFGGGIRRSLNDAYQEAKSRFGIITSLPFKPKRTEQSDADKLKFYLRSERNRERYWDEINKLISKDPELLTLYHQEMGKVHARRYGKRLREIGFSNAWFAILEGIPIASGATKEDVERTLQSILPAEKRRFVYIFQLKKK